MTKNTPTVESWEVMNDFKRAIGNGGLQKIFSVGHNQINRYCRNPAYTSDSERNPLDRMRIMLSEVSESGKEFDDAVLSAIRYMVEPMGLCVEKAPETSIVVNEQTAYGVFADLQIKLTEALSRLKKGMEDEKLSVAEMKELFEALWDVWFAVTNASNGIQNEITAREVRQ